jgi:hypothetical protein
LTPRSNWPRGSRRANGVRSRYAPSSTPMDSAARAATNEARSCELPSDRRGPVRHCSLTGVAMAKVLGVSALRNGAFQFAPLMSRSTSAFRVRVQASFVLDVDVDIEHLKCAAASSLPWGIAQRPDRDALSFTSAAFTRLCGRAVLATNRQPAHEMPLGRLCGQTTSATTSPICRDFLRGPRRRSNPGPSAYPSVPRSTSQKI